MKARPEQPLQSMGYKEFSGFLTRRIISGRFGV
jgi:hypothetical protein